MDNQAYIALPTERFKGKLDPGDITEEEVICPKGMMGDSFIAYYSPDHSMCICVIPGESIANLIVRGIIQEKDRVSSDLAQAVAKEWSPKYKISETLIFGHDKEKHLRIGL